MVKVISIQPSLLVKSTASPSWATRSYGKSVRCQFWHLTLLYRPQVPILASDTMQTRFSNVKCPFWHLTTFGPFTPLTQVGPLPPPLTLFYSLVYYIVYQWVLDVLVYIQSTASIYLYYNSEANYKNRNRAISENII